MASLWLPILSCGCHALSPFLVGEKPSALYIGLRTCTDPMAEEEDAKMSDEEVEFEEDEDEQEDVDEDDDDEDNDEDAEEEEEDSDDAPEPPKLELPSRATRGLRLGKVLFSMLMREAQG